MVASCRRVIACACLAVAGAACVSDPSAAPTTITNIATSTGHPEPSTVASTTSSTPAASHHLWIAFSLGGFPLKTEGSWTSCVSTTMPSIGAGTTITVTAGNGTVLGGGTFRSLTEVDLTDPVLGEAARYAKSLPPGQDGECIVVADFEVADSTSYRFNYGGGDDPGRQFTRSQLEEQGWLLRDGYG